MEDATYIYHTTSCSLYVHLNISPSLPFSRKPWYHDYKDSRTQCESYLTRILLVIKSTLTFECESVCEDWQVGMWGVVFMVHSNAAHHLQLPFTKASPVWK